MNQKEFFVASIVEEQSLKIFLVKDDIDSNNYHSIRIENSTLNQSIIIPNDPMIILYLAKTMMTLLKQHIVPHL
jgi:hypothetical protein